MKFFEINADLENAIKTRDVPVRIKIELVQGDKILTIAHEDIVTAGFSGIRESGGGISSRGEVTADNPDGKYTNGLDNKNGAGMEARVWFTAGNGLAWFRRFTFYVDQRGIIDIRGYGKKRMARIGFRDISYKMGNSDGGKDWKTAAVITYSSASAPEEQHKSLLHKIAARAGINPERITSPLIPVTLPFVKLTLSAWAEMGNLARAMRAHLECLPCGGITFINSPYGATLPETAENSYEIKGNDIFYLRTFSRGDLYRNDIRLKVNMPVPLEKREIWRYNEAPELYGAGLKKYYPFVDSLRREIETGEYTAQYRITDENGAVKTVLYADEIDTKEEAEARLDFSGGEMRYARYNVTTNGDKALLRLERENEGELYSATIHGRPIVRETNRTCYKRDSGEISLNGSAVLNVSGQYFSDYKHNGTPHYEDWVNRELTERKTRRRDITLKTHCAIFNVRVGAGVKIKLKQTEMAGTVRQFHLRYGKERLFVTTLQIIGGHDGH